MSEGRGSTVSSCGCVWTPVEVWEDVFEDHDVVKGQMELCPAHHRDMLEEKLRTSKRKVKETEQKLRDLEKETK